MVHQDKGKDSLARDVSRIGDILILDDSALRLKAGSRDIKTPSVRQADGPTNFN